MPESAKQRNVYIQSNRHYHGAVNSQGSDEDALKSLFRITLETRNFEINQLVQRNNFFMIFQGVLLAGVVQSAHAKPVVSFLVCLAGLFVSIYQVRMASGAKFWQEYWEAALTRIENDLVQMLRCSSQNSRKSTLELFHLDDHIYSNMVKDRLNRNGQSCVNRLILNRYSVSKTPIYVAICLSLVWSFLVLCTLRVYPPLGIPSFIVGF